MSQATRAVEIIRAAGTGRVLAASFAALLGLFIIYGVGFASPTMIHNAAHDVRHTFAFPCH
jgi:cobalt transporter subunit CbtB